jgi:NTP pyrophosphatase (non-canonical NTP hydrolase)
MPRLKRHATLRELQQYVMDICTERGWHQDTHLEKVLLLTEEIGELVKAIRQHVGLYDEKKRKKTRFALEEELADVLSYLIDLANYFNIDLEAAFRKKERINAKREWKK